MAELRCARDLGVSRKRFNGWVPSGVDRVEWDDEERAWMLALRQYEDTRICPLCGMDMRICHDEDAFNSMYGDAEVTICFAHRARELALDKYAASGVVDAPHSQTTRLTLRENTKN